MNVITSATTGIVLLLCASSISAQKRPLDHHVYDSWESIHHAEISESGEFIQYEITPQQGDAVFQLKTKHNRLLFNLPRVSNAKFTQDESFLIAKINPTFAETRQARIDKKDEKDMPKDSLLIVDINDKSQWKVPSVSSYKLAEHQNNYVAFLTVDTADRSRLHLRNLVTGDTLSFPEADQYAWSPNEDYLVFSKKNKEKDLASTEAGLYIYNLSSKQLKKISNGQGTYKQLQFDEQGTQLAFLADKTAEKSLLKDFKLYYYTPRLDSARIIASQQSAGVPTQWYVSGDGELRFSRSGQKVFFGLAPIPMVKDTSLVDFEHAKVDIWNWKDDYLQPQQLANLKKEKSRSFLSVVYPKNGHRILPLVDDTFNDIQMTDDADNEWILATTDSGHRIAAQWQGYTLRDIYVVSSLSEQKRLVKKMLNGRAYLAPNGDFVLYFDREVGNWYSYQITSGKTALLNDGLPVNFADEENDTPTQPGAYGLAGWAANGKSVYIYMISMISGILIYPEEKKSCSPMVKAVRHKRYSVIST